MIKIYVGIHDRINDKIKQDHAYQVESIRIVKIKLLNILTYLIKLKIINTNILSKKKK